MKKLLVAILSLALVGTVQAKDKKHSKKEDKKEVKSTETLSATSNPTEKGAKFKFTSDETYDFGEVQEGPQAEHIFEFKNVGNEPLIIQNASASCGCTTPEWPKEPILPGKTGKITVHYNTQGRPGPFTKSIFISSNATKENERKELFIKGSVKPKDGGAAATPPAGH